MPPTCWSPPRSPGVRGYFQAVAGLPQVAAADVVAFLQMSLPGPGASPYSGMVAEASLSGGEGVAINRVKVLAGRIFNPADPHAVMISPALADRAHLRPGGTLHLIGYPQQNGNADIGRAVRLAFRVSAIVVTDDEIVPATHELAEPRVLLSPAFSRTRLAQSFNPAGGASYVVLRPGASRGRIHQPGRRPGRAVPGGGRPGRPPGHRVRGRPAGHSAGSGGPRDFRRDGRPDRAGRPRAAAEPPARPRLGGIPDPARPRHDPAPSRGAIPGQGGPGDRGRRCGRRRGGHSRVPADAHRGGPFRRAQPGNRRQPDDSGHRIRWSSPSRRSWC